MIIAPIIVLCLILIDLFDEILRHGEKRKDDTYDGWEAIIITIISLGLLHWGGFFDKLINAVFDN